LLIGFRNRNDFYNFWLSPLSAFHFILQSLCDKAHIVFVYSNDEMLMHDLFCQLLCCVN